MSPGVSLDDKSICRGDTDILDAGPDGAFDYSWTVNGTPIDNLAGSLELDEMLISAMGIVSVSATDDNNCTTVVSANVEFVDAPMISLPTTQEFCSGSTAVIELQSTVSVVNWYLDNELIPNENGVSLTITEAGTYEAIAAEGQQCEARAIIEVTQVNAPVLGLDGQLIEECSGTPVILNLTSDTDAEVTWDRGGSVLTENSDMLTVNQAGVYTATVINSAGCESSVSQEVQFFDLATAGIDDIPDGICAGVDTELVADSDGDRFEWLDQDGNPIPGATGLTQSFSQSGDYSFVAYNSIDCPTVFDFSLDFRAAPDLDLGPAAVNACEDEVIELATPSEPGVVYVWSRNGDELPGETTSSLTVVESGTYELVALNDIQCESRQSVEVTLVQFPSLMIGQSASFCEDGDVMLSLIHI